MARKRVDHGKKRTADWLEAAIENGIVTGGVGVNAERVAAAATSTPVRHAAFMGDRAAIAAMSEHTFQGLVVGLAEAHGWEVYHTADSRKSQSGFPDLCMVRGPKLCFAELKREGQEAEDDQTRWMTKLARTGADVFLWQPSNWDGLHKYLTAEGP